MCAAQAFVLAQAEVDRARSVAERALSTISFREEAEKLNVWVALLGLENLYGTRATLAKAFERAVQHNNPKHVYLKMATLYQESGKAEVRALPFAGLSVAVCVCGCLSELLVFSSPLRSACIRNAGGGAAQVQHECEGVHPVCALPFPTGLRRTVCCYVAQAHAQSHRRAHAHLHLVQAHTHARARVSE